jgi:hypothetical protein
VTFKLVIRGNLLEVEVEPERVVVTAAEENEEALRVHAGGATEHVAPGEMIEMVHGHGRSGASELERDIS